MNNGDRKLENIEVILTPTTLSMKKKRLTAAEIEEIKMKTRQLVNTERQNPEDSRVKLENLTLEEVGNTIERDDREMK